jgi:hypothetical protein
MGGRIKENRMTDNNEDRTTYEEFVKEIGEMIDDLTLRLDHLKGREVIGLFTFEQVRCRLYMMRHGITKQQFLSYVSESFEENVRQFKQISPALKKLQEIGKEHILCSLKNQ